MEFSCATEGGRQRKNIYSLWRSSDCDPTILSPTKIPNVSDKRKASRTITKIKRMHLFSIWRKSSKKYIQNISELRTWISTGKIKGEGKQWWRSMSLEMYLVNCKWINVQYKCKAGLLRGKKKTYRREKLVIPWS